MQASRWLAYTVMEVQETPDKTDRLKCQWIKRSLKSSFKRLNGVSERNAVERASSKRNMDICCNVDGLCSACSGERSPPAHHRSLPNSKHQPVLSLNPRLKRWGWWDGESGWREAVSTTRRKGATSNEIGWGWCEVGRGCAIPSLDCRAEWQHGALRTLKKKRENRDFLSIFFHLHTTVSPELLLTIQTWTHRINSWTR